MLLKTVFSKKVLHLVSVNDFSIFFPKSWWSKKKSLLKICLWSLNFSPKICFAPGSHKEKSQTKFLMPIMLKKSQISHIWHQKSQAGNPVMVVWIYLRFSLHSWSVMSEIWDNDVSVDVVMKDCGFYVSRWIWRCIKIM